MNEDRARKPARKERVRESRDSTITSPDLPNTVRVFGKVILIWNTIALVLALVLIVVGLAHGNKNEICQGGIQGIAAFLFFRSARAMIAARRSGVCGLAGLCVAALVAAAVFWQEDLRTPFGDVRLVVFVPLLVAVLYARPLFSAFRNWKRFH